MRSRKMNKIKFIMILQKTDFQATFYHLVNRCQWINCALKKKNIHIKFVKWMCNFCRRFVCFTVRSLARSISFMSRVQNVAEFSWIMLISTKCCTVSYMKFWIWKQHYTHKWIYTTTYYNLWCLISLQNPTFFFSSVLFEFSLGLFTRSNEKLLDYCSGFIRYFLKLTE